MNIAFYAPMRPPGASGASGDRTIAALLWGGLEALGHHVMLASPLKSWSAAPQDLAPLMTRAQDDAGRLQARGVDLFFTYHCYYKAPDLIGPLMARAGVPYVIAEASLSPKRKDGPWAEGYAAAARSIAAAHVLLSLSARDRPALDAEGHSAKLLDLPLYSQLPRHAPASGAPQDFLTVAMMREGDKLQSYRLLADSLGDVTGDWRLTIVGDGPVRATVEAAFAPFGSRVTFKGALAGEALAAEMARAGTFVWPGTREGFGIVYLEAQAAGLPCVALNEPGPQAAIGGAGLLCTQDTMADTLNTLLAHETQWLELKEAAIAHAGAHNTRARFLEALERAVARAAS